MQIEQKENRIYKPQSKTTLSAEETNQVTTELENVIAAGGLTPSAGTLTQVRDAVQNIVNTAANELQSQIDAITSASDVFDVVGTYAQLQDYDTTTVPVNDIIKVLQDETRNNAMTYYRWNGTAWVFIGSEGPYYTVAETDTAFAKKTDLPPIATTAQAGLVKPDGQTIIAQQDGTISTASTVLAALPLFTCQFSDHIINNPSYLRADTFSWQAGSVYVSAYEHLVSDITGITAETETVGSTTITFYRATDGHKIVLADQESKVSAIYTATGIAWYYILDTTNTRFKLPRSQWGFVGLRSTVGQYVAPGLPNITGRVSDVPSQTGYGAFSKNSGSTKVGTGSGNATFATLLFDASASNDIYGAATTVQPKATQMYLYFYCGNTVINQTTVDVGEITEELNNKADTSLSNLTTTGKIVGAGLAMPSDKYINLTLGASETTYTAPANGWFLLYFHTATSGDRWAQLVNETKNDFVNRISANMASDFSIFLPVTKGDIVLLQYANINLAYGWNKFRFYYAVGAESEAN